MDPKSLSTGPKALQNIASAGFVAKLASVAKKIGSGLSYVSAVIMILEFAFKGRDLSQEDAVKIAKERGIDELMKGTDDPDAVLKAIIEAMDLPDPETKKLILDQLTTGIKQQAAASVGSAGSVASSIAPAVTQSQKAAQVSQSPQQDIQLINSAANTVQGKQQAGALAQPSTVATAVETAIAIKLAGQAFYRSMGMSATLFFRLISPFMSPQSLATLDQWEKRDPNLYRD